MITDKFNGIIAAILLAMLVLVFYSSGQAFWGVWGVVKTDINKYLPSSVVHFDGLRGDNEEGKANQPVGGEPVEFINYPVYEPDKSQPVFAPASQESGQEYLAKAYDINGGLVPAYHYTGLTDCWQRECKIYEGAYYVNAKNDY